MNGFTNVTANNIQNNSHTLLASGVLYAQVTDQQNNPINVVAGSSGGGTVVTTPTYTAITNGSIGTNVYVVDTTLTIPAGCYVHFWIIDTTTGSTTFNQRIADYPQQQPSGLSFSLDSAVNPNGLNVNPPVGTIYPGSVTIEGSLSVGGTITGSAPGSGPFPKMQAFSNQLTWTFAHNSGTQSVMVQCFDASWNTFIPENLQNTDINTTVVTNDFARSGYMVISVLGNYTPAVSNPNYLISNPTSSQSITGDYPFTFGGSLAAKRIENVRYADQFSGSDMGAQINAAYADLPSTGGTVYIPAGSYSFSTPIVLSTANKLVSLKGAGAIATSLQYTASSGTALTVDNYNGNGIAAVLEDFELTTAVSGATTTGLSVGPTNSGSGTRLNRLYVHGFQIQVLSQTYGVEVNTCQLGPASSAANSVGFETGSNNNADDNHIRGGVIQGCSVLVNNLSANPLWIDQLVLANATVGPSISNSGAVHCNFVHFFNQSSGATTYWYSNPVGSVGYMNGCKFEDGKTSGSLISYITVSGGIFVLTNSVFISNGETVSEAIQFSGSGQGFLSGNTVSNSTYIPTLWNTSYGSGVVNINPPATNLPNAYSTIGPLQIRMDGTSGQVLDLYDTTGTTHKYLRVNANQLQLVNSGYTSIITTIDDTGNITGSGAVKGVAGLVAGTGTTLARYARYTPTLSPSSVAANTTAEQTFTSVLTSGDIVVAVRKPTAQAGLGIVGWRESGTSLLITFSNNTASPITPTASEVYQVITVQ